LLSIALNIITIIFIVVTIDALWILFVLYRAFVKALELFLDGTVHLPWQSKWSIVRTVIDVYEELFFEDPIEVLVYMPLCSFYEPDFGAELFCVPFLGMMRDGVIDFDVSEVDKE